MNTKQNKKNKSRPGTKKRLKKAPAVSRTKGYYRFSKDFPGVTDSNGYRDNTIIIDSPAKKAATKRKLTLTFVCVFLLSFLATTLAFAVSNHAIAPAAEKQTTDSFHKTEIAGNKTAFLSGEVLSSGSISGITASLGAAGVNAVAIELKDASGYFYFEPSLSVSAEALSKTAENAADTIKAFKDSGFTVFAVVSCFADDIYARNNQSQALYTVIPEREDGTPETSELWYDRMNSSHAWLSPYSEDVLYYLNSTVSDVLHLGVNGILFENMILPDFGEENIIIPGAASDGDSALQKSMETLNYINNTISCRTGVVVQTELLSSVSMDTEDDAFSYIVSSGCDSIVLDARNTAPETTLDRINVLHSLLAENESNMEIIPLLSASADNTSLLGSLAQKNIVSFIMYNENSVYKSEDFR